MYSFEQVTSFENLYYAYMEAKKGQRNKWPIREFEVGLLTNLMTLRSRLVKKTYKVSSYHIFTVTEPKKRIIMALPFVDRVVQHALCKIILPRLEEHFISVNAANRKNKGTHFAMREFMRQLTDCYRELKNKKLGSNENLWCLKCDIKGYFYNIDRARMKEKLEKLFGQDKDLMWLIGVIIDSSPDYKEKLTRIKKKGKGLPIGNLTSQFFAIYYLSAMDHFIKEKLRVKNYVRYMDDFTLLLTDKEYLRYCQREISKFLEGEKLELNEKTQIFAMKQGVDFLGWHFYLDEKTGKVIKLIRKDSKERRRRKNKRAMSDFAAAQTDEERQEVLESWKRSMASWTGHAKHGHTYHLRKRLSEEVVFRRGEGGG